MAKDLHRSRCAVVLPICTCDDPDAEIHWSEVVLGHDRVPGLTQEEHGLISDAVHATEDDSNLGCACEPVYAVVEDILAARSRTAS